jgi:hypothetical protein
MNSDIPEVGSGSQRLKRKRYPDRSYLKDLRLYNAMRLEIFFSFLKFDKWGSPSDEIPRSVTAGFLQYFPCSDIVGAELESTFCNPLSAIHGDNLDIDG